MPNDLCEKYERRFWQLVFVMHRRGVPYNRIHLIVTEVLKKLELMAHTEAWAQQEGINLLDGSTLKRKKVIEQLAIRLKSIR
jgi:hypothetical protein